MADRLRLYGRKALVTSGGSGIGEATARTLMKHGATVLAVDDMNSGVEQHFASVKGIVGVSASYRKSDKVPLLVQHAAEELGEIDILVNDFGLRPEEPISKNGEPLERLLRVQADLIMSMCRASLPHMKKSPAGRIINMGLLRSCFAVDGNEAFAFAERSLANVTRALAAECGEYGITANYIQPGAVMTPESREVFRKNKTLRDHCISTSAAHRVGEPVDIAKVALFLASDDAVFVSGTGIRVDGGRVAD